jgi:hypothetical protein
MCDFVAMIEVCQWIFSPLYIDLNTKLKFDAFDRNH